MTSVVVAVSFLRMINPVAVLKAPVATDDHEGAEELCDVDRSLTLDLALAGKRRRLTQRGIAPNDRASDLRCADLPYC